MTNADTVVNLIRQRQNKYVNLPVESFNIRAAIITVITVCHSRKTKNYLTKWYHLCYNHKIKAVLPLFSEKIVFVGYAVWFFARKKPPFSGGLAYKISLPVR